LTLTAACDLRASSRAVQCSRAVEGSGGVQGSSGMGVASSGSPGPSPKSRTGSTANFNRRRSREAVHLGVPALLNRKPGKPGVKIAQNLRRPSKGRRPRAEPVFAVRQSQFGRINHKN
jgi:hypothetical protein